MQIKINVLVCQLCKKAPFGFILSKKDCIDPFHKYLLNTYNAPGYWARTEHSVVNKNRHSPCSHGARAEAGQKDVNQEFPQINISLQAEINALKARRMRGPRRAECTSSGLAGRNQLRETQKGIESRMHGRNWHSKARGALDWLSQENAGLLISISRWWIWAPCWV